MAEEVTTEILICSHCYGTGAIEVYSTGRAGAVLDTVEEICTSCKGSGRRVKVVTVITTVEPYDNPNIPLLTFKQLSIP